MYAYLNAESFPQALPAGSLQGAYLGGLVIIKFNNAFLRPPFPRPIGCGVSRVESVKFIDYGSFPSNTNLKTNLVKDPLPRTRQVTSRERSGHGLPLARILLHHQYVGTLITLPTRTA